MALELGNQWDELLREEFDKDYYKKLRAFLIDEYRNNTVYPKADDIFNAFRLTDYDDVKAVILGQDPYHEPGQAQGLAFSVPANVQYPPSLVNIFKELESDQGITVDRTKAKAEAKADFSDEKVNDVFNGDASKVNLNGETVKACNNGDATKITNNGDMAEADLNGDAIKANLNGETVKACNNGDAIKANHNDADLSDSGVLVPWAERGVLLLNTVLTVRAHQAGSHRGHGWEQFTDAVIKILSSRPKPMVFILWGANAISKKELILEAEKAVGVRHLIITAPHPSPLSAYRGFFGGRYFSRTNFFLEDSGTKGIDWSL